MHSSKAAMFAAASAQAPAPPAAGAAPAKPGSPRRDLCEVPPPEAWVIADLGTAGIANVHSASVSYKGGPVQLALRNVFCPFNPSSMDGGEHRQTLTLRLSKSWEVAIADMERRVLERVASDSLQILGRELTNEEVHEMYKSCTRKTAEYPMNLRVKVTKTGLLGTRYWDANGNRLSAPDQHMATWFNAMLNIRALWCGANAWGLVIDVTDLQEVSVDDDSKCPF